jgi:ABC-type proline/glycine betaine transport system substrate-binding protein
MPHVIPSRFAEAKLAEKNAWKRYAEAKGDNWREAFTQWVEARDASLAAWVDEVTTQSK